MKIKKIQSIKNMAVFKDFNWDSSVYDAKTNKPIEFQRVNIFYGRNYSGKTTLSRIVRSFETGSLNCPNASFQLLLENESILTERDCQESKIVARVFNKDFVQENLLFFVDPNAIIQPFAVLGEENAKIEKEISQIRENLGMDDQEKPTGLYKEKYATQETVKRIDADIKRIQKDLNKKMDYEANDKDNGIRYNIERYNQHNYNIAHLKTDINTILSETYNNLSKEEFDNCEAALKEHKLNNANLIRKPLFRFSDLVERCKELCERKIGSSEKIQDLLRNIALEDWVRRGMTLNKELDKCAFCGQVITDARWDVLHKHFDQETEKLLAQLKQLDSDIDEEKTKIDFAFTPDKAQFYSIFHPAINLLMEQYASFKKDYCEGLDKLKPLIKERIENILSDFPFLNDVPVPICEDIFETYAELKKQSDSYGEKIADAKRNAQDKLRLHEVKRFVTSIDYKTTDNEIRKLEKQKTKEEESLAEINNKIADLNRSIKEKQSLLNDEEKGASKVNGYLRECFGFNHLALRAITSTEAGKPNCFFEVVRNGERAEHLSEGECSLIAFCYYMAKLNDIETANKKPIVWIDDPISSLDSNHVYYIYSLIEQLIHEKDKVEQLFITTHNLQFLNYLGRLHLRDKKERSDFIIERDGDFSFIKPMPHYLRSHGTEFNYWFKIIYMCATQPALSDENKHFFELFGNAARKFLETYLFYKYPDASDIRVHLKKFLGDNQSSTILIQKITNEQSHANGDLENHELAFDVPEIISSAKIILERIQYLDADQYNSLVSSVNQSLETT